MVQATSPPSASSGAARWLVSIVGHTPAPNIASQRRSSGCSQNGAVKLAPSYCS